VAPWTDAGRGPWVHLVAALALMLGLFTPHKSLAVLGEPATGVSAEGARLKAALRVTSAAAYTIHELQLPGGTTVREFAMPGGLVFAVSWLGPDKPDFRSLLGSYFTTYAAAPRSAGLSRTHLAIDETNLVVRAGGHPRAFFGLAYVPQLLPQGVDPGSLQ
jgi:hypothetical protein